MPGRTLVATAALLVALAIASPAAAFCGFYVSGADAKLFNNATQVVLMREGTRTVLSMQNNYQGPPEDFAMVVPVPVVLQKENVKTLPREVFDAASTSSPRRGSSSTGSRTRARSRADARRDAQRTAPGRAAGAGASAGRGDGPRRHDRGAVHGRRVRDRRS